MASYHQLNPLIRIKETTLLQMQDWQQLIAAESMDQSNGNLAANELSTLSGR